MSIYNRRNEPAYRIEITSSEYSKNPYILKWWNIEHDNLILLQINKWQWMWYWFIAEEIVKNTPSAVINLWKTTDPICSNYAWNNVLMYFAKSRAEASSFTRRIRYPQWKVCPLCNNKFIESSLPLPFVERLGIDHIDFCSPCLSESIYPKKGNNSATKKVIVKYFQDLALIIDRIPPQNIGEGKDDFRDLNFEERLAFLRLLRSRPTLRRIKVLYGSWLNGLIQSGILEDGTRKGARGIQTISKDGHVCLSLGEKTIDDFLFDHGIEHEIEPKYPLGNYRGDFKVGEYFIEYFGLQGDPDYDTRTKEKLRICQENNIKLIELYPEDIISQINLSKKLSIFIGN